MRNFITITEPAYPEILRNIAAPPEKLFFAGELSCLSQPSLAIVGTRKPSAFMQGLTERWAQVFSAAGIVIVSGLALGIDGAAHRGALRGNAKTIAVLGCGLAHDYPRQHRDLKQAIVDQGGCLLSEYPPDTPPLATYFPRRNRIISGLSEGVVVMEAALRSGSLITARIAAEQGKEVMAVPGSIYNPMAQGCHWLIREGATLVTSVEEIAATLKLGITSPHSQELPHRLEQLSKKEQFLLTLIQDHATPFDHLLVMSAFGFAEITERLLTLEVGGWIEKVVGGYVRK